MPETIRSLIIILFISGFILHFHKVSLPKMVTVSEFKQWQFLMIATYLAAFLSNNYWLFVFLLAAIIKLRVKGNRAKRFTLYMWLLPLLPMLIKDIPGAGGIRFLFELDFPRILSLTILLPLFLTQTDKRIAFLRLPSDKYIALFLLVNVYLTSRNGEMTNILRSNLYLFLDIFLPYYVASRTLNSFSDFKTVSFAIFASISMLAGLAIFSAFKSWHLYSSLAYSLDIYNLFSQYLFRDGILRAAGPFSSPIVLGYILTIGLGMGLAVSSSLKNKKWLFFTYALYCLALITTLSRGPWVGAIILITTLVLLTRNKRKYIKPTALLVTLSSPILFFTTAGQKVIKMVPFIGESNDGTITYRQDLFEQSLIVIKRQPFFGSNTYLETPEMLSMMQGQGIIDIVNSYLRIALDSGLFALSFFMLFFITLIFRLYLAQKKIPSDNKELHLFSISLLATMVSVLIVIATVSSIDIVPHFYWILGGLIASFLRYLKLHQYGRV